MMEKKTKIFLGMIVLLIIINILLMMGFLLVESPITFNHYTFNNYTTINECEENETIIDPEIDCEIIPLEDNHFKLNCTEVYNE